jgi:hypothetical protein
VTHHFRGPGATAVGLNLYLRTSVTFSVVPVQGQGRGRIGYLLKKGVSLLALCSL